MLQCLSVCMYGQILNDDNKSLQADENPKCLQF